MVEKGIREGLYHSIYQCKNEYIKDYDRKKIFIYSILGCK